jgi:hypothetical protein
VPSNIHAAKIQNIIKDAFNSRADFRSIAIFSANNQLISLQQNIPWIITAKDLLLNDSNDGTKQVGLIRNPQGQLVFRIIRRLYIDNKKIGSMLIDVDTSSITSSLEDYSGLKETGETVLVGKEQSGQIVFYPPPETPLIQSKHYHYKPIT